VNVTDDALGTVVPPEDAKRHWRTDSVEITIDPRGDSRDTSTTYTLGAFPVTDAPDSAPAGYRDADAHQGPIAETAPGTDLAATVTDPYEGYTLEARIDLADLPAAVEVSLRASASGTAHVFAWTGETMASDVAEIETGRRATLRWQLDEAARKALADGGVVLVGWEADAGGTTSLAGAVRAQTR
jgi:hypothetical protein